MVIRKARFPALYAVEVLTPDPPGVDRLGNPKPSGTFSAKTISVIGWHTGSTEEVFGDSVLRTKDTLSLYVHADAAPQPDQRIRLPDGSEWDVDGHPIDHRHGPWFDPGAVVVSCKKVEG
ncbi:Uncharacterised protein [Corynebacterium urealyticum]|nr:Uncharacterised protein [Corynebacterium urealyticum]